MTKPLALIIEDNEDQNLVFTTALDQAGYETESIYDGAIALERLKNVVPNMVILDLHLPNANGSIVLNQIRADPRLSETRVILATADSTFASGLQFQTELVLLKPVSFAQLKQLASRFLQSSTKASDSQDM